MDGRCERRRAGPLTLGRARLDPRRSYKPLDVGNGIVAGTLTPGGRWLDLGIAHPVHGRVIVTDAPAFTGRRFDQREVRAYRASLASRAREGFGLALLDGASSAALVESTFPLATHRRPEANVEALSFAPQGRRGAVQVLRLDAKRDIRIEAMWTGTMRVARAAYTQLTPGGALPDVEEHPAPGREGRVLWIADERLGIAVAVALPAVIDIPAGASDTLALALALGDDRDAAVREAVALAGSAHELMPAAIARRRAVWAGADLVRPAQRPQRRALAYAVDCASCDVGGAALALLADHQILPLVWTRDAYYVCRALLALDPGGLGRETTTAFLRWCFETAERPDGWWPRASLASGGAKDPVFQLDQQLYPLLLLEDLARLTNDDTLPRRYADDRDRIVRALLAQRTAFGLVATAETPADDPIDAPFHFSSHVLLWRVLRDLDPATAVEVREATLHHFAHDELFAYAVRGPFGEGAVRYHDANDLPTVFAPGWGFCAPEDARWRATIAFAWSAQNRGFIAGPLGGLGSVHTLDPWPLGDLQDIVVGRLMRDRARVARARARLRAVAMWDGMLPEAYDARTGAVTSRHWFAWPIALWALLESARALTAP